MSRSISSAFTWRAAIYPGFDHDLAATDGSYFWTRLDLYAFWWSGEQVCDAQLHWREQERADHGAVVVGVTSVNHATEDTPDDDIFACDNFRACIDIAQHDYIAGMMD